MTTHRHPDHWQALAEVKAATGAVTVAHPADAPGIPVETDEVVEDGGTVAFGDTELSVIHLVGRTPGSIALVIDADGDAPHIFTGDCLFPGGVGDTQKDAARFTSLFDGVESKGSTDCPTRPGCSLATAATPPLARSPRAYQQWRTRPVDDRRDPAKGSNRIASSDHVVRQTSQLTNPDFMSRLENKIFGRLPDATWVHPGHGKRSWSWPQLLSCGSAGLPWPGRASGLRRSGGRRPRA